MKAKPLIPLSVVLLAFGVTSCGGGGGGANTNPPPRTQVGISVSPTSATVQSGQTQQFTATVTGTSNTAVTWSASAGSISSSGLYSAPTTSSTVTATITATAQADTSKSAQALATVTPPPAPTTASVSLPFISLPTPGAIAVKLIGSGFASTDTQVLTPTLPLTTRIFVSTTEFDLGLGFDNNHFRSGFYSIADCNGSNCSNPPASFAFLGDGLSRLGMGGDGRFCQRDAGTVACFNADLSAAGSPFPVGNGIGGIAFYAPKNLVLVSGSSTGPVGMWDIANPSTKFGPANVTGSTRGIAQKDGTACVAQPDEGIVTIFPVDLTLFTSISSPAGSAGSQPWSVGMVHIGAELDCVSISQDNRLARFSTADGTLKGSLVLSGLTSGGNPRIVTFNSGSAVGTAALLNPLDNTIVFVNLNTMAEIRRVSVPPTSTSRAIQIAVDETAGNIIIVFGNVSSGTTFSGFAKLAVASGAPVPYSGPNATAALLFMDVAVSPISPKIIGGSLGQNIVIPVQ